MLETISNSRGRVALITGGAKRVGRALTFALARRGFQTAIHFHSSRVEADEVSSLLTEMKCEHTLIPGDLTEVETPRRIVKKTLSVFGRIDVLVNNAAILVADDGDAMELAKMKTLNIDAAARCIEAAISALKKSSGTVINIADVAGIIPFKQHRAYSLTQSALIDLTRRKALELAPYQVTVNAICPATVLPPTHYSPEAVRKLTKNIPLGRIGTPDDVTDAALYLADAGFVTGQILALDGGYCLTKTKIS